MFFGRRGVWLGQGFSSKKWTEEKKEGQGLALGGFKKEDSRRVFSHKELANMAIWRVLTEQERGEWPEGFSDAGRKLFSQQLVGRCTC